MIKRVAVVNRGEAALRFLQSARVADPPIEPVLLYTRGDQESAAVRRYPTRALLSGGREAYEDAHAVIKVARQAQCDSIWLGWGFASERSSFVHTLEEEGFVLLAPRAETLALLGDKGRAIQIAKEAGLYVGTSVVIECQEATELATQISQSIQQHSLNVPLLLKATEGGGGRGIFEISHLDDVEELSQAAMKSVHRAGLLSRFVLEPSLSDVRHIEAQILGDGLGRVVVVGLRDCSVQRRRQKLLEECPPPHLSEPERARIEDAALKIAEYVMYRSAGTVEFLYHAQSKTLQFLEVNPRLQVEHPVTELVYGVDLVLSQIQIARGLGLPHPLNPHGVAIEARVYAEDPLKGFSPAPGRLRRFRPPFGVHIRVDTGFEEGDVISEEFDPLISKIITWGKDRATALKRLTSALDESQILIEGGSANHRYLAQLCRDSRFIEGRWHTQDTFTAPNSDQRDRGISLIAAALDRFLQSTDRHDMGEEQHRQEGELPLFVYQLDQYMFFVAEDQSLHEPCAPSELRVRGALVEYRVIDAYTRQLTLQDVLYHIQRVYGDLRYWVNGNPHQLSPPLAGPIYAPSMGIILSYEKHVGEWIERGDRLTLLESMKVELSVEAPRSGWLRAIYCQVGEIVRPGQPLMLIDTETSSSEPTHSSIEWPDSLDPSDLQVLLSASFIGWPVPSWLYTLNLDHIFALHEVLSDSFIEEVLKSFLDLAELFDRRPRQHSEEESGLVYVTRPLLLLDTLQRRGVDLLPSAWRETLEHVLARFDIHTLKPSQELTSCLSRLRQTQKNLTRLANLATPLLTKMTQPPLWLLDRISGLDPDRFRQLIEVADEHMFHRFNKRDKREISEQELRVIIQRLAHLVEGEPSQPPLRRGGLKQLTFKMNPEMLLFSIARCALLGDHQAIVATACCLTLTSQEDAEYQNKQRQKQKIQWSLCEEGVLVFAPRGVLWISHDHSLPPDSVWSVLSAKKAQLNDLQPNDVMSCERVIWMSFGEGGLQWLREINLDHPTSSLSPMLKWIKEKMGSTPITSECVLTLITQIDPSPSLSSSLSPLPSIIDKKHTELANTHQHSAPQHSAPQHSAPQHSAPQHSAPQHRSHNLDQKQEILEENKDHSRALLNGLLQVEHIPITPSPSSLILCDPNPLITDLLPSTIERLQLNRLSRFQVKRLSVEERGVALYHLTAHENSEDVRIFAYAEISHLRRRRGRPLHIPQVDQIFYKSLRALHHLLRKLDPQRRLHWNRLTLRILPVVPLGVDIIKQYVSRLSPAARWVGLEKIVVQARFPDPQTVGGISPLMDLSIYNLLQKQQGYALRPTSTQPLTPRSLFESRVVAARRRGLIHPAEVINLLEGVGPIPRGRFIPYELREGVFIPAPESSILTHGGEEWRSLESVEWTGGRGGQTSSSRAPNTQLSVLKTSLNSRSPTSERASVVAGVIETPISKPHMTLKRVVLISDPTLRMGALAAQECQLIIEAFHLAEERNLPIEWISVSSGARIDWETGTENLDACAQVLKCIIRFTQKGGMVNVIVPGICVGAQSYWNAEATMMTHCNGVLVMTDRGSMVLTGKRALEFSGCVSAQDELDLGGYTSVMGPNGQAQLHAPDLPRAYRLLYRFYKLCYIQPHHKRPPHFKTRDPSDRDIGDKPYPLTLGHGFQTIREVFSELNHDRKRPFSVRPIMSALLDENMPTLERWGALEGGETAIVWQGRLSGYAVTLIGIENQAVKRVGLVQEGPTQWSGGTLYPQASRKVARAIRAAHARYPVIVLANLSGFDGSPESLRQWQLEYGAEIAQAVESFDGPIYFIVLSRYHGGAYVVFSKKLNPKLESIALRGSFASVIGGAPAAAVIFGREVRTLTARYGDTPEARSKALSEIAQKFDQIHNIHRALSVGSIDSLIDLCELRSVLAEKLTVDYQAHLPSNTL